MQSEGLGITTGPMAARSSHRVRMTVLAGLDQALARTSCGNWDCLVSQISFLPIPGSRSKASGAGPAAVVL